MTDNIFINILIVIGYIDLLLVLLLAGVSIIGMVISMVIEAFDNWKNFE